MSHKHYPSDAPEIRKQFQSLSMEEGIKIIQNASPAEVYWMFYVIDITLRPNQILNDDNWRYCFYNGGRGTGKDKMMSVEMRNRALSGEDGLAVIAPNFSYLHDPGMMVDSILSEFPPDKPAKCITASILLKSIIAA